MSLVYLQINISAMMTKSGGKGRTCSVWTFTTVTCAAIAEMLKKENILLSTCYLSSSLFLTFIVFLVAMQRMWTFTSRFYESSLAWKEATK